MKKMIFMAFAALSLVACNNENETDKVETTESNEVTTTSRYTAQDGDVTYKNDKVMVMKNNDWVEADNDVTLDDGVVVYRSGKVTRDGKEVELHDGEIVTRTGRFFDNAGNAMENAWDATKEGAKDAGRAVKDAANKVGNNVEDAVDGNDNH